MKKNTNSVHHILPRSKNGSDEKSNLATISQKKHDLYHRLFENMTPEEILSYLVNYFWKSQDGKNGLKYVIRFKNSEMNKK